MRRRHRVGQRAAALSLPARDARVRAARAHVFPSGRLQHRSALRMYVVLRSQMARWVKPTTRDLVLLEVGEHSLWLRSREIQAFVGLEPCAFFPGGWIGSLFQARGCEWIRLASKQAGILLTGERRLRKILRLVRLVSSSASLPASGYTVDSCLVSSHTASHTSGAAGVLCCASLSAARDTLRASGWWTWAAVRGWWASARRCWGRTPSSRTCAPCPHPTYGTS